MSRFESRAKNTSMIKRLFRWLVYLFIICVVLIVAAVLLLDTVAKEIALKSIRAETGMDAKIGKLSVGLLSPTLNVEKFKLYNTAEFGGSPFLDLEELHVEYDREALRSGKIHFKLIRLDLAEVTLVKNKSGRLNFERLQKATAHASGTNSLAGWSFAGIDALNVTIAKARIADLNSPAESEEVDLPIKNEVFTNIHSAKDFLAVAIVLAGQTGVPIGDGGIASPKAFLKKNGSREIVKELLSPK